MLIQQADWSQGGHLRTFLLLTFSFYKCGYPQSNGLHLTSSNLGAMSAEVRSQSPLCAWPGVE